MIGRRREHPVFAHLPPAVDSTASSAGEVGSPEVLAVAPADARLRSSGTLARLGRRAAVRGGVLVLGSTMIWNLSTFSFHAVAGRFLSASQYGAVATVTALMYVATPVVASLETLSSRVATRLHTRSRRMELRGLLSRSLRQLGLLLGFAYLVVASVSSPFAGFLKVPTSALLLIAAAVAVMCLNATQRGVLQGTMRFERYSLGTVVEGMSRVLIAAAALALWRSVDAAIASILAAAAAGCVASWLLLRFLPHGRTEHKLSLEAVQTRRESTATLVTIVILAGTLSIDMFAAKHYLHGGESGAYAAVSLVGKTVFFATSALAFVLFPRFCAASDRGDSNRGMLVRALLVVAVASVALTAVNVAAPHLVLKILYGHRYLAESGSVGMACVAFAPYALMYVEALYLVAHGRYIATAILSAAMLAQLALLYHSHETIAQILYVDALIFGVVAAVLTFVCFAPRRPPDASGSVIR